MILRGKIEVLKRPKKGDFLKGESMDIAKNRNFFLSLFSLKLCQKTLFFDIYERTESFSDQKVEVLTRAKNRNFLKGLVHGYCRKIEISLIAVFH